MAVATASKITLKGTVREERGKEWAKKARREGKLPASLYGPGREPVALTLDFHDFEMVRQANLGERIMLDLEVSDGTNEKVFIVDLQREPVSDRVIHVDFYRVSQDKTLHLPVRVRFGTSIPAGVKEGGILETIQDEVMVEALPAAIPGHIDVDLGHLDIGDSFHVSDLPVLEGVTYLAEGEEALFTVVGPQKAPAETTGEAVEGEAAEGGEEEKKEE